MGEGIYKFGSKTNARPTRRAYVAPNKVKVNVDRAKNLALAQAKQDVNAGLNPKEIETLYRIENSRREKKREQLNIVDSEGRVIFSKNGGKSNVKLYPWESALLNDKILTHNHPSSYLLGGGMAGRIGTPVNGVDVAAGIRHNAKEIRASAQGYVYSVKRPKGGWGSIKASDVEADFMREINSHNWASSYVNGAKTLSEAYNRQGRYNVGAQNAVMRKLAKKYGFIYTRRRIS